MKKIKQTLTSSAFWLIPVIITSLSRIWLIRLSRIPFNADEAIVALMARHIRKGEIPTFFYGQGYMGSLDAIIVSLGFNIFGEEVWVIRLVQSCLYLITVATTALIAADILKSKQAGLIAGLIVAIPTVNVTLYTTVSLGGYGEVMVLGNLMLLGALKIFRLSADNQLQKNNQIKVWILCWGAVAGLGFWAFGLSLVYSIPVAGMLLWNYSKYKNKENLIWGMILISIGFLIGASPWWVYGIRYGLNQLIEELAGSAISGSIPYPVLIRPFYRLNNLILLGSTVILGMRPPWGVRWLMLPMIPFVMVFWIAVVLYEGRQIIKKKFQCLGLVMLVAVGLFLLTAFVLTPFGADPSGRYFVPLIVPLSVLAADFIHQITNGKRWQQIFLLSFILIFHLGGTVQCLKRFPPGLTTQFDSVAQIDHRSMPDLILFLEGKGITRGYTNYWVAYPLAFLSDEQLIFLPKIPYHEDFRYTERDDRYPPYQDEVKQASHVAYITTNHQALNQYLRDNFSVLEIDWKEKVIGDYHIFYELTEIVYPEKIGLGQTTQP